MLVNAVNKFNFTYIWLIWFWEATALSEKYGMIFAPQQEQNPRAEELSVIATLSRVMTEDQRAGYPQTDPSTAIILPRVIKSYPK